MAGLGKKLSNQSDYVKSKLKDLGITEGAKFTDAGDVVTAGSYKLQKDGNFWRIYIPSGNDWMRGKAFPDKDKGIQNLLELSGQPGDVIGFSIYDKLGDRRRASATLARAGIPGAVYPTSISTAGLGDPYATNTASGKALSSGKPKSSGHGK